LAQAAIWDRANVSTVAGGNMEGPSAIPACHEPAPQSDITAPSPPSSACAGRQAGATPGQPPEPKHKVPLPPTLAGPAARCAVECLISTLLQSRGELQRLVEDRVIAELNSDAVPAQIASESLSSCALRGTSKMTALSRARPSSRIGTPMHRSCTFPPRSVLAATVVQRWWRRQRARLPRWSALAMVSTTAWPVIARDLTQESLPSHRSHRSTRTGRLSRNRDIQALAATYPQWHGSPVSQQTQDLGGVREQSLHSQWSIGVDPCRWQDRPAAAAEDGPTLPGSVPAAGACVWSPSGASQDKRARRRQRSVSLPNTSSKSTCASAGMLELPGLAVVPTQPSGVPPPLMQRSQSGASRHTKSSISGQTGSQPPMGRTTSEAEGLRKKIGARIKRRPAKRSCCLATLEVDILNSLVAPRGHSGLLDEDGEGLVSPEELGCSTSGRMHGSLSGVWREQDSVLTSRALPMAGRRGVSMDMSSPWWLALWGFRYGRPCSVLLQSALVALLMGLAVVHGAWDWAVCGQRAAPGDRSLQIISGEVTLVIAGGTLISLACLNFCAQGQDGSVVVTTKMLVEHSVTFKYDARWKRRSSFSNVTTVLTWLLAVVMEGVLHAIQDMPQTGVIPTAVGGAQARIASFAVISGLFSALALYVQHVCNGLASMVDSYCSHTVATADLKDLKGDWNVLQAILRRSAQGLAPCLLSISLTPLVVLIICAVELFFSDVSARGMILVLLPKMLLGIGVCRVGLRAGQISGMCSRVPVFLNSLLLGGEEDPEASGVVHFIERTHAGFYAFDMKVDFAAMSKFAYLVGAAALTLVTKAVQ